MPNGSLFSDEGASSSAQDSASAAKKSFPDSPPSAAQPCVADPGKKKKGPKKCTIAEAKAKLDACDGGTGVYAKAKTENGGKDIVFKAGKSGFTDMSTGEITLDKNLSCCNLIQQMSMELNNLSNRPDFQSSFANCKSGDLSRVDFIKAIESREYDGVTNTIKAFDACKKKWGCTKSRYEWARSAKNFESYYKRLANSHKEGYGKWWKSACKVAYEKKHPPAKKKSP